MDFFFWIILIAGIIFVIYNILLGGSSTSKFKSDLPKTGVAGVKAKPKVRKGVLVACLILFAVSLALLVLTVISFLS